MKKLENLTRLDREIIRNLKTGKDRGSSIEDIQRRLRDQSGLDQSRSEVNDALGQLIKYGAVRSYEQRIGEIDREERKYFLSRGLGSGGRNKAALYGTWNPLRDFARYISRIFGSFFVLFGFGMIFFRERIASTGDIISSQVHIPNLIFILSFMLAIIGILLWISERE